VKSPDFIGVPRWEFPPAVGADGFASAPLEEVLPPALADDEPAVAAEVLAVVLAVVLAWSWFDTFEEEL